MRRSNSSVFSLSNLEKLLSSPARYANAAPELPRRPRSILAIMANTRVLNAIPLWLLVIFESRCNTCISAAAVSEMPWVASSLDSMKLIPEEPSACTVGSTDFTLSSSMHSTIVDANQGLCCSARRVPGMFA